MFECLNFDELRWQQTVSGNSDAHATKTFLYRLKADWEKKVIYYKRIAETKKSRVGKNEIITTEIFARINAAKLKKCKVCLFGA